MKTTETFANDVLEKMRRGSREDWVKWLIESHKSYASQAIDECADRAELTRYSAGEVNKNSILKVKNNLK